MEIKNAAVKFNNNLIIWLAILVIFPALVILSGCVQAPDSANGSATDSDTPKNNNESQDGDYIYRTAAVESTEILLLESFPVQVQVIVKGYLPDGCTEIDSIEEERDGNTFTVTITTKRPRDLMCTQAIVFYEKVVPLNVYGLKAGKYIVNVNSVTGSFELPTDNIVKDADGVLVFTEDNNGRQVELARGETFRVKLNENPTTGYQWTLNATAGLEIMNDNYVPPSSDLLGAGGIHEWDIRTAASGTQQVTAVYSRSWENLTGTEQRFVLTVEVE